MSVHRSTPLSMGLNSSKRGQLKFFSTYISSDRRNNIEIESRILQAKKEFSENEI